MNNKVIWRGDSALNDGNEEGIDLSKGMYDAGDHMKFGFPMAFTATVLSWAILEYGDQMEVVDQLQPAKESLKWITDYLVNSHPTPNQLYVQVNSMIMLTISLVMSFICLYNLTFFGFVWLDGME